MAKRKTTLKPGLNYYGNPFWIGSGPKKFTAFEKVKGIDPKLLLPQTMKN